MDHLGQFAEDFFEKIISQSVNNFLFDNLTN